MVDATDPKGSARRYPGSAKSKNDYAEYAMIITERKRKSKKRRKNPAAADRVCHKQAEIDVDNAERWMIETGFRMVENERVRTRSRSVTVRILACAVQRLGSRPS